MLKFSTRLLGAVPLIVAATTICSASAQLFYPVPTVTVTNSTAITVTLQICGGSRSGINTGAPNGVDILWQTLANYTANGNQFITGDSSVFGASYTLSIAAGACVSVPIGGTLTGLVYQAGSNIGLDCGTTYVFRVQARMDPPGGNGIGGSDFVFTNGTTTACSCGTFTLGYWKNHSNVWPVTSLALGTVTYNQSRLLAILNQPVQGNGLISLSYQLIAAKLNIANGASCAAAAAAVASADSMIGGLVVPPIGSGYLAPKTTGGLTTTLDDFNNGLLASCPAHCQ